MNAKYLLIGYTYIGCAHRSSSPVKTHAEHICAEPRTTEAQLYRDAVLSSMLRFFSFLQTISVVIRMKSARKLVTLSGPQLIPAYSRQTITYGAEQIII
jgi:hypothetical protein